jgi:hypothetical protein
MTQPRVLQLKASKECFEEIISGRRKVEYREFKPFWTSRLESKSYDEVHFRNGYNPQSPFARLEFKGCKVTDREGKPTYRIELGKVLEVLNQGVK